MSEFEAVIGLEVHAQLSTRSKMFCSCAATFGAPQNTQTCPTCLGLPGALPVANAVAIESAVKMGLATHCQIAARSVFARKNYFYPDCPKNYQISQYELPLCEHGHIVLSEGKRIGITRIHLEEDAGKLTHSETSDHSFVDMNRVGVPLIEIVSEPDMRTAQEATEYAQRLRTLLRYLRISDGNMEEGSLRCDVNVSLREKGSEPFGVKTEVKNLNSFKAVENAVAFEIDRQSKMIREGERIEQQTLLWDAVSGSARLMRSKEQAHDYRYFPEPDLLVLNVSDAMIDAARDALPELPDARAQRFIDALGLPAYDARVLTSSRDVADYYEAAASAAGDAKATSNWVMGEVLRELKERRVDINDFAVTPEQLAEIVTQVTSGAINMPSAKEVFKALAESGGDAKDIIASKGLQQISDTTEIDAIVADVIDKHPDEVAKYLAGKDKLLKFLVGQVMKASRGQANPQMATDLMKTALEARR